MLKPLRLNDVCICYCPPPNGRICQPLQNSVYYEGLPAAMVSSLCCTCRTIISICTGSTKVYIHGQNAAHELSYIPCNTPIPSVQRTFICP